MVCLLPYPLNNADNKGVIMWHQQEIHLPEMPRGFHLITDEIVRALPCLAECHQGCCIYS